LNLPKLWCAGKLGWKIRIGQKWYFKRSCPENLRRIHITCCICRPRRLLGGKYTLPHRWIKYTLPLVQQSKFVLTLLIDPRGHFTMLRCSCIIVFGALFVAATKLAFKFTHGLTGRSWFAFDKIRRALLNVCEFFANFPTW